MSVPSQGGRWTSAVRYRPKTAVKDALKSDAVQFVEILDNAKTREILYSDTWGAGHELKRMSEDQAFTIATDAFFRRPQN